MCWVKTSIPVPFRQSRRTENKKMYANVEQEGPVTPHPHPHPHPSPPQPTPSTASPAREELRQKITSSCLLPPQAVEWAVKSRLKRCAELFSKLLMSNIKPYEAIAPGPGWFVLNGAVSCSRRQWICLWAHCKQGCDALKETHWQKLWHDRVTQSDKLTRERKHWCIWIQSIDLAMQTNFERNDRKWWCSNDFLLNTHR